MTVQAVALQPGGIFTGHTDREVSDSTAKMKNELVSFLDMTEIGTRRSETVFLYWKPREKRRKKDGMATGLLAST